MNITYSNCIVKNVINPLRKAVGWSEFSPRQLDAAEKNSEWAITAFDGEKAVGMARAVGDGGYHYLLCDVMVFPEYQGHGIGRAMLESLDDYINSCLLDNERIMITLLAEKGKEAFYEKFGYEVRPSDMRGAGMSKCTAKKDI